MSWVYMWDSDMASAYTINKPNKFDAIKTQKWCNNICYLKLLVFCLAFKALNTFFQPPSLLFLQAKNHTQKIIIAMMDQSTSYSRPRIIHQNSSSNYEKRPKHWKQNLMNKTLFAEFLSFLSPQYDDRRVISESLKKNPNFLLRKFLLFKLSLKTESLISTLTLNRKKRKKKKTERDRISQKSDPQQERKWESWYLCSLHKAWENVV